MLLAKANVVLYGLLFLLSGENFGSLLSYQSVSESNFDCCVENGWSHSCRRGYGWVVVRFIPTAPRPSGVVFSFRFDKLSAYILDINLLREIFWHLAMNRAATGATNLVVPMAVSKNRLTNASETKTFYTVRTTNNSGAAHGRFRKPSNLQLFSKSLGFSPLLVCVRVHLPPHREKTRLTRERDNGCCLHVPRCSSVRI